MSGIIIGIRFLLEAATVLGLLGGLFTQKSLFIKISCALVGLLIAVVWSRYGAPKSPHALAGFKKLLIELPAFILGAVGFWQLYGQKAALLYASIATVDLVLLYALGLNEH